MSSSVVVFRESETPGAVGFSPWMNKMTKGMENKKVGVKKNLSQGKHDQGEGKKKLCMCSPTNHPGSFRCRYHRAMTVHKVKPVQDPASGVAARHFVKLSSMNTNPMADGVKPPLSRFSKAAAAVASELPR